MIYSDTAQMRQGLYFSRLIFHIRVLEPMRIPSYKGSTFRGGFGHAFRRIVCLEPEKTSCKDCCSRPKCIYAEVFESSPSNTGRWAHLQDLPRPFIIEPPEDTRTIFEPGDQMIFTVVLIGRAVRQAPFFILAFREQGMVGLGKRRAEYEVLRVEDGAGREVFLKADGRFHDPQLEHPPAGISMLRRIRCSFLTPTRIRIGQDLVMAPNFQYILKALIHRISALLFFHYGHELDLDFRKLMDMAGSVKCVSSDVRWYDWERFSSRQNKRMMFGGFIGDMVFEGDMAPFMDLLTCGEVFHIGKNCAFGLGKYRIYGEGGSGDGG